MTNLEGALSPRTMGRIWVSKEVERPIKVAHVIILQYIASYGKLEESRSGSERGEMHLQDG